MTLQSLLSDVHACQICKGNIPDPIRPVLQLHRDAHILIVGQAPGRKVQESGVPFDDASGERLRDWMGVSREIFYDEQAVAILPMAFCYPGKGKSGDLPPPPICAQTWREKILSELSNIRLTLVIGQYAMGWHLDSTHKTLTETVRHWAEFGDDILPLPHPSPRNNIWFAKNGWFAETLLPTLRERVVSAMAG